MGYEEILWLVVIAAYGAVAGLIIGAVMLNPWLKRSIRWRTGMTNKGFAFLVRRGRKLKLIDWDVREPNVNVGDQNWTIDPDHVYDYQSIPIAVLNDQHATSVSLEKSTGDRWQDPVAFKAFIVRLRDTIEAQMAKRKKPWQDIAILVTAVGVVIAVILGYASFQLSGQAVEAAMQAKAAALSLNSTLQHVTIFR